ncbi:MAG: hypothetical protein GEU75_10915 [Dehalococcoidia bacterium]|nr:hypothetical protein [Dehalococcoidia bacterium]
MLTRLGLVLIAAVVIAVVVFALSGANDDNAPEESYAGTWRSALLPAASSPGRIVSLIVDADGSVAMISDFQNNEPPVSEEGQWVTDAGALVVTLSTTDGNPLFRPIRVSFERDGDTIRTVGSSDQFGSEGITLRKQ